MTLLQKAGIGLAVVGVMSGCANEQMTLAEKTLGESIAASLTAKADAGKFYKEYRVPTDEEIATITGYKAESEAEAESLHKEAEAATRKGEVDIVWPKWIEAIKAKSGPAAEAQIKKGNFEAAREIIWRASTTEVPIVDAAVREWGIEFLNTRINPADWARIENDIRTKYAGSIEAGDYKGAIDMLKTYPRIRTFSKVLDNKQADVTKEAVALGVKADEIKPEAKENLAMVGTVENIIDERDVTTNNTEASTSPELEEFNKKLEEYRKALVRFNATEDNAQKVAEDFRARLKPYLEKLTKQGKSTDFLYLGTTAVNARTDVLVGALIEDGYKVWQEALKAELKALLEAGNFEAAEALIAKNEGLQDPALESLIMEAKAALQDAKIKADDDALKATLDELTAKVVEMTKAGEYDAAREAIRDVEFRLDPKWDAALYVRRIDLLNSIVNPRQYWALKQEICEKAKALKDAEDYEGLEEWVKTYPGVHDTYQDIADSVAQLKENMVELDLCEKGATDYTDQLTAAITGVLESRDEGGNLNEVDLAKVDETMVKLHDAYIRQWYTEDGVGTTTNSVRDTVKRMVNEKFAPMTTKELNAKLAGCLAKAMEDVPEKKAARDGRRAQAKYAELIKELDAEVSLDDQIALAEAEIARIVETAGPKPVMNMNVVLGAYAKALRTMKKGEELAAGEANTILVAAVYLNQVKMIDKALELGADVNVASERDPFKRPAMLVAIERGNTELLAKLTEAGAVQTAKDAFGSNAIHYAVRRGDAALVKVLLQTLDVKATNELGETPLFLAARRNQTGVVEQLIAAVEEDAREAFVSVKNAAGEDAMAVACREGAIATMDVLEKNGAKYGNGNLVTAAMLDNLAVAKWLVERGADVNAEGVMAAAALCGPASATYRYLVSQGGIAVEMPRPACCPTADRVEGNIELKISGELK